jgi:hypothetical protein
VLIVLKSGSLNLLECSGPVQAYNGIALRNKVDAGGSLITVVMKCGVENLFLV